MLGAYARGAGKDLAGVCPFGVNLPWFSTCSHSSLTDGVITAYSAERSKQIKKYFASFYPTYKAQLTRKDMDRLADNTRRYRQQMNADEERRAEHLTRRKELKLSQTEEQQQKEKEKRKLRDKVPGVREAQNKLRRDRRANDPGWKAQANAKRNARDAKRRKEKAEKEAAAQIERMT